MLHCTDEDYLLYTSKNKHSLSITPSCDIFERIETLI